MIARKVVAGSAWRDAHGRVAGTTMNDSRKRFEEARRQRERLKGEHPSLFDAASRILFSYDPIGLNNETNADEYDFEATRVLLRLPSSHTVDDLRRVIHQEFVQAFDLQ